MKKLPDLAHMQSSPSGNVVIVSGPSGAGKSTVVARLLRECPLPLALSVSATTRPPRDGEQDGVNYYFLSRDEFFARRERSEFLEYKEVFGRGHWYGTLQSEVTTGLNAGKWVLLEIDVEGMLSALAAYPRAITIFIRPDSLAELERRLRQRGTESEEAVARRLEVARRELTYENKYRHTVINDTVERAVGEICQILTGYVHPA